MTNRTITAAMTRTIDVPGATIAYDVRAGDIGGRPLMLIGSPMGAGGFATLASQFPERTVITYDPRGVERSRKDDDTSESTPEQHADDIHAVISAVGVGPVDLFASSGGAVNALALVARHPEDVRTLVAHEPPLAALVNDRHAAFAATEDIRDKPDVEALRGAATRIIVAVGAESDGEMAHRGGEAVASRLGVEPVVFPSGHGGFLGGEYGQTGEPDAFGAKLREVLAEGS
ncbi:MAG: alpha/beta fold hydrolase [Chloroflexota bacterium]